MLPIENRHRADAATLVDAGAGLRAGDALHLAIAVGHGGDLATLDRNLALAATAMNVRVHRQKAA